MRLIDADSLKNKIYDSAKGSGFYKPIYQGFIKAIDVEPTVPSSIDTDCIRHGKWIGTWYDGYADGFPAYEEWECSECGNEEHGDDVPDMNPYCRWCGAKMDEDE